MKKFILLALLLLSNLSEAKQVKIGILDTGLNFDLLRDVKFCSIHDYSLDTENFKGESRLGYEHGTSIVGHYAQNFNDVLDYCIVYVKIFTEAEITRREVPNHTLYATRIFPALNKLVAEGVDYVNMSYGDVDFDPLEHLALTRLSKKGIPMFAAAGNSGRNLDKDCLFFPACYNISTILSVGALDSNGKRSAFSNYGSFLQYAVGIISYKGIILAGTSQAAARFGVYYILNKTRHTKYVRR